MGFLNKLLNKSNAQSTNENIDIPPPPEYNLNDLPDLSPEDNQSQKNYFPEMEMPMPANNNSIPPPTNHSFNIPPPPPPVFESQTNQFKFPNSNQQNFSQNIEAEKVNVPIAREQQSQEFTDEYNDFKKQSLEVEEKYEKPSDPFKMERKEVRPASSFSETFEEESPEEVINEKRKQLLDSGEPIFSKVEDYKRIIDASNHMKDSVKECENILKRLNELKNESDSKYQKWKDELLDIHKKFSYVDKVIFD